MKSVGVRKFDSSEIERGAVLLRCFEIQVFLRAKISGPSPSAISLIRNSS